MLVMILLYVHMFYILVLNYYYKDQVNEYHVQYNVYKNFHHIANNYIFVVQNRMVMNKYNEEVHDMNANQVQ